MLHRSKNRYHRLIDLTPGAKAFRNENILNGINLRPVPVDAQHVVGIHDRGTVSTDTPLKLGIFSLGIAFAHSRNHLIYYLKVLCLNDGWCVSGVWVSGIRISIFLKLGDLPDQMEVRKRQVPQDKRLLEMAAQVGHLSNLHYAEGSGYKNGYCYSIYDRLLRAESMRLKTSNQCSTYPLTCTLNGGISNQCI